MVINVTICAIYSLYVLSVLCLEKTELEIIEF